jgi:hypothetical protein
VTRAHLAVLVVCAAVAAASCVTPPTSRDVAIVSVGATVAGAAVLVGVGALVAPALDDVAVDIEREHPGLLRGDDAGPTCVAWDDVALDGSRSRVSECAEWDPCEAWEDHGLRNDCRVTRARTGGLVVVLPRDLPCASIALDDAERDAVARGKTITAIRSVRERTGCGLAAAKAAVDEAAP